VEKEVPTHAVTNADVGLGYSPAQQEFSRRSKKSLFIKSIQQEEVPI
jgi:hypothetical protein